MSWGLKTSFRTYIRGPIAGGRITTTAPATDNGARTTFTGAKGTWSDKSADVRASGAVNFTGHHGELNLTISSPRIVLNSSGARLLVDARTSDGRSHSGLAVASLDLSGRISAGSGKVTIANAPATLTSAGTALFSYSGSAMYPAGTELDPVSATLSVKGAVVPTTPPATKPTPKPTTKPTKRPQDPKPAKSSTTTGRAGDLTWGVKASFRSYITGPIAQGSVSVSSGATAVSGGYRFGQSTTSATPPSAQGTTGYRGTVRFHGHHGQLDMSLTAPSVRVTSSTTATLSAQVTGRGRIDVAVIDLGRASRSTATGWVQYANAPAALTAAGAGMFSYNGNAFYPAGTVVDPVTFSVGSTAAAGSGSGATSVAGSSTPATAWTPPAAPPATTGLVLEQDEVTAGDEVTASGTGFLPNESGIRVVLYSTPLVLAENVTADATGRATWKGTIPPTIEPGEHTLTFQGSVDRGVVIDVAAAEAIVGCELSDARLDWGFKESFRAYVSGSIANGDWTTSGNAAYATPQFTWSQGAGVLDEQTRAGELSFEGGVEFTGHDGALDTTIANPVVTIVDDSRATLAVDYTGGTMDAAMAGKDDRRTIAAVPFADLDLSAGTVSKEGQTVTITDVPTTLTSAGSAAFPNYETGAALDPVTLTYTVATDCAAPAAQPAAGADDAAAVVLDTVAPTSSTPWLPWLAGTVLAVLVSIGGTVLVMRRRTPGADA
ncbi:HtaA domain-containing protein [Aeromicrobium sp. LTX1]|uniref:HtaA domain-containing protein n=1 Tax=Aeromicrobium sp. LTX1 TaxID=3389798 RepID=UPI00396B017B